VQPFENNAGITVEAHGFKPCEQESEERRPLGPGFMDPDFSRTFFVTSITWQRRRLFQTDTNAKSFLRILFGYRDQKRFLLHEFVIMPDHFHLIITPAYLVSLEKAMQFIKGGFSYRFKKETGFQMDIWENSFTNHRIRDSQDFESHRRYIHLNPVRAGLADSPASYPYSSAHPGTALDAVPQRLKPVA
jgi:putative transposase